MPVKFLKLHWPRIQTLIRWGVSLSLVGLGIFLVAYVFLDQLFTRIDQYRPQVEARLSAVISAPVRIRKIEAEWRGLKPEFRVIGLQLRDPAHPDRILLDIPRLGFQPSLRQTLRQWSPRLNVRVDGLNLHITQQRDGAWRIEELASLPPGSDESRRQAIRWVLAQGEWRLTRSVLSITPAAKPSLVLADLDITNRNGPERHALRLSADLGLGKPLRILADLKSGDVLNLRQWGGAAYIAVPRGDWSSWAPVIPQAELTRLDGGGEAWLDLADGRPVSAYLRVQLVDIQSTGRGTPVTVAGLAADASFRRLATGWEASISPHQGVINGQSFPIKTLIVQQLTDGYRVVGQALHMQGAAALAAVLPVPDEIRRISAELQPSGYLTAFSADMQHDNDHWNLRGFKADIRQLSWLATPHLPGAQGVNGWVSWQNGQGSAGIRMQDARLDLRQVFREPVHVNSLQGHFRFRQGADAWLVQSDTLSLSTPDASGEALLSVWIPRAAPDQARMQLLAGIHDGRVDSTWRYVPWPSAGDDTLAWLKSSLKGGRLKQGDFMYEGPLIDGPGREPSLMQMRFQLEDATLAYAPGWPEIRKLQAEVTINNRHLQVKAHQGQIYESLASNVVADIPELRNPVLHIDADLDSTGEDIFRLFRESPLRSEVGRMSDLLEVKGEIGGHLSMSMPLADMSGTRVAVDADLPGNPILLKEAGPFDLWLSGQVRYETGKGLTSRPLNGFFLGQPLNVQFRSVLDEGNVVAVQIQGDGSLTPASIRPWMGNLVAHMRGSTRFKAFLSVPVADDPVHLSLDADLAGLYMDLPEPFAKQAESRPLHFEVQLDGEENLAMLRLENRLQSLFAIKAGKVSRMIVQLGDGRLGELPPQGLWVRGNLDKLDLDSWLPWLRPQTGRRETGQGSLPELESFTLAVADLSAGGYRLPHARLGAEPQDSSAGGGWRVQIESDRIAGEAKIPEVAGLPVSVTLYRLSLPLDVVGHGTRSAPGADWSIPAINLDVRNLSYSAWPGLGAGTLNMMLRPTQEGLRLDNLLLKHGAFSFAGKMDWQYRSRHSTSVRGTIKTADIAKLFTAFEYPAVVNSESGEAAIALSWPDDPSQLQLRRLGGDVDVHLRRGRLLKLNRTVSLTRLFGVLDTDNIKRRLQLDFSDITQRGMAFDDLTIAASFADGSLKDELHLQSPSMTVHGGGTVDLTTTKLDQRIQIAVPLASAVPIAAALVAGPVIGGALVAAESVLDDSLRKMTAFNYQVQGNWDNPVIERIRKPLLTPWRLPGRKENRVIKKP
ncbi:uncharacterized protein (TIGR02099 family) [Fluviicoccus keumensis]|uniref:Uncharacterized protein (TIGR02099 family) n=1 Tax=Fluviicoccus keumensis TaxID=1435465 RepID=A0A4Q7Z4L7_9GAMM|nr:YhdP family protein [Fluviicoccus keumensis]RZU44924.1 uncharacterized protein (TIGR02099 family) [Fluviicoccus keumensis]